MGEIVITAEMIQGAKSYLTITAKQQFVANYAAGCFDRMEIAGSGENGAPLPPLYKENAFMKHRYLMCAFAKDYLGQTVDEDTPGLMSVSDYDAWAGSHVFNQMERLKSGTPSYVRDKIFDILADYKELERRLNGEIYGMLTAMNDPISRFLENINSTVTPENIAALTEELHKVQGEITDYAKGRGQSADS